MDRRAHRATAVQRHVLKFDGLAGSFTECWGSFDFVCCFLSFRSRRASPLACSQTACLRSRPRTTRSIPLASLSGVLISVGRLPSGSSCVLSEPNNQLTLDDGHRKGVEWAGKWTMLFSMTYPAESGTRRKGSTEHRQGALTTRKEAKERRKERKRPTERWAANNPRVAGMPSVIKHRFCLTRCTLEVRTWSRRGLLSGPLFIDHVLPGVSGVCLSLSGGRF